MKRHFAAVLLCFLSLTLIAQELPLPPDEGKYEIREGTTIHGSSNYELKRNSSSVSAVNTTTITSFNRNMRLESTTVLGPSLEPERYTMTAVLGSTRQTLDVNFAEGVATAVHTLNGNRREKTLEIEGEFLLMDNNCAAHLAIIAARLSPLMEPDSGQIFVPSTFTLAPYSIEPAGSALYTVNGEEIECQKYTMTVAEMLEMDFYLQGNQLIAMVQPHEGIEFVLRR